MVAELCTSAGAGLEIATAAFPQHFLLLAGAGHFAKALAKAMGKPVFRVIQTRELAAFGSSTFSRLHVAAH